MEYLEYGDLGRYISQGFREVEVKQITTDLLDALRIMHDEGFAHRDLKPQVSDYILHRTRTLLLSRYVTIRSQTADHFFAQNVFIVEKPPQSAVWRVKLGDFGISKRVNNEETALRTGAGTLFFQAPEISGFVGEEDTSVYSHAVDLWSLGCIVYNLVAESVPFPTARHVNRYCNGRFRLPREQLVPALQPAGVEFVERLLTAQPPQRLSARQALQHPWILDFVVQQEQSRSGVSPIAGTAPEVIAEAFDVRAIAGLSIEDATNPESSSASVRRTVRPASETPVPVEAAAPLLSAIHQEGTSRRNRGDVGQGKTKMWRGRRLMIKLPPSSTVYHALAGTSGASSASQISTDGKKVLDFESKLLLVATQATCAVLSGNGLVLATGSQNGTIVTWDTSTGRALGTGTLKGHTDGIIGLSLTKGADRLASISSDGTLKYWLLDFGRVLDTLSSQDEQLKFIAISPDKSTIATGATGLGELSLWSLPSLHKRPLRPLFQPKPVMCLTFSSDGIHLAAGHETGEVLIWDVKNDNLCKAIQSRFAPVQGMRYSPDGKYLVCASHSDIEVWHTKDWSLSKTGSFGGSGTRLADMSFARNSNFMALALSDAIHVWHTKPWSQLCVYYRPQRMGRSNGRFSAIEFTGASMLLVCAIQDDGVTLSEVDVLQDRSRVSEASEEAINAQATTANAVAEVPDDGVIQRPSPAVGPSAEDTLGQGHTKQGSGAIRSEQGIDLSSKAPDSSSSSQQDQEGNASSSISIRLPTTFSGTAQTLAPLSRAATPTSFSWKPPYRCPWPNCDYTSSDEPTHDVNLTNHIERTHNSNFDVARTDATKLSPRRQSDVTRRQHYEIKDSSACPWLFCDFPCNVPVSAAERRLHMWNKHSSDSGYSTGIGTDTPSEVLRLAVDQSRLDHGMNPPLSSCPWPRCSLARRSLSPEEMGFHIWDLHTSKVELPSSSGASEVSGAATDRQKESQPTSQMTAFGKAGSYKCFFFGCEKTFNTSSGVMEHYKTNH